MNKVKSVLFAAGISLALAFTFSCSSDSGGSGGGEQSNISSGTEANAESSSGKGKNKSSSSGEAEDNSSSGTATDDPSSSSLSDSGGSSSSGGGGVAGSLRKDQISGVSQKGPFVKGSTATLYELDDKFVQTGRSFRDIIADDKGSFDIKINVELVSPYAMLEADGYYRNEVTGKISTGTIKLYAVADIREKSNVNVNILTHLEYYRVQKLVEGGKSLQDAKKQAQKEILAVFGISGSFENSEDMSIFGTTDGDAALLAISVLLQGELSEGQFVERLTDFRLGFRETGAWDNETAKNAMADWASAGALGFVASSYCLYDPTYQYPGNSNCWPMPTDDMCKGGKLVTSCSNPSSVISITSSLAKVRGNILGWNLSSAVPDFEKYVNNYWYVNYGLGACNASLQNSIKSSSKNVDFICKDNAWAAATEYERDTYKWGACAKEGEIKDGQASSKKYICKEKAWVLATAAEIELGLCTKEGEVKEGLKQFYICKNKNWSWASERDYDIYLLGACSKEGEIKTGQSSGNKYICKENAWVTPSEYELDTYQWVCTEGEIKDGQASGKKYVCKYEIWRIASYKDIVCFKEKNCNYFTDARDNQRYAYVVIGEQTWMAENLNYNVTDSKCYSNDPTNCNLYGRLYNWVTAMGIDAKYEDEDEEWGGSDVKHKGICPAGWHLPSNEEWQELVDFAGGNGTAGKLKATDGWDNNGKKSGNGTDDYGFSALPGGYGYGVGGYGYWWSASEYSSIGSIYAYARRMYYDSESVYNSEPAVNGYKSSLFSVRCVQD